MNKSELTMYVYDQLCDLFDGLEDHIEPAYNLLGKTDIENIGQIIFDDDASMDWWVTIYNECMEDSCYADTSEVFTAVLEALLRYEKEEQSYREELDELDDSEDDSWDLEDSSEINDADIEQCANLLLHELGKDHNPLYLYVVAKTMWANYEPAMMVCANRYPKEWAAMDNSIAKIWEYDEDVISEALRALADYLSDVVVVAMLSQEEE